MLKDRAKGSLIILFVVKENFYNCFNIAICSLSLAVSLQVVGIREVSLDAQQLTDFYLEFTYKLSSLV